MLSPLTYKIALSLFPRIGAINARRLVAYTGSLNAIFEASKSELQSIPGIGKNLSKTIYANRTEVLEKAEQEIEFIQKFKIKTFFYLDNNYPKRLALCEDAPVIIYMKGDVNLNYPKIISVIGTRNATENGRQQTLELIAGIKEKGIDVLVVSGLAYGIDIAAHKNALKIGLPTIGVLGHGLDKMYPSVHASVAKEMVVQKGGLLSDFPSSSAIDPGNFLRRNRIIAGLSDCTVVVESAAKGGALVTADIANSYNREVVAFPGRPSDQYAVGCNNLIKENKAALISNSADLIQYMNWEVNVDAVQSNLWIELLPIEKSICDALGKSESASSDTISRETNLSVQKINAILLDLEFKGIVKSLPGGRFKLLVPINNKF